MTTRNHPEPITDRRRFLKGLVAGSGAAALAASVPGAADATMAEPVEESVQARPEGYRETEHIRDYYRSARL